MATEKCCHSHGMATPSVFQTLDELEFERGIWSSALYGEYEKLKKQLDRGIDSNIQDSSGYTALHYAARNGKESICVLLLQRGANVNMKTHGGATPLLRAASQGHINIVRLLLKHAADPTICDSDGKTPLHKAVEGSYSNVVRELLDYDHSLKNIKDNKGNTPAFYVKTDSVKILELF